MVYFVKQVRIDREGSDIGRRACVIKAATKPRASSRKVIQPQDLESLGSLLQHVEQLAHKGHLGNPVLFRPCRVVRGVGW